MTAEEIIKGALALEADALRWRWIRDHGVCIITPDGQEHWYRNTIADHVVDTKRHDAASQPLTKE